jgi:hypothetical protein
LALRFAATLVAAAGLQALYAWGGHRLVAYEYTRRAGPFLYNLIPAPGAHALAEYYDRADAAWLMFQVTWITVAAILILAPVLDPVTARVHDACLRFGRACARHPRAFLAVGAVAVGSITAIIGWFALLHFPNSGDEYCYLYQADTFLAGRLANTPHPLQTFFDTSHVIERNGRVFSVFPPGWPVVIAAAMRLGIPSWAINPLLSAGLFLLTFRLANRVTGDGATAALASVTLASSSYFLMTGASYFSHTACAFFVVGAMLAMLRMAEGGIPSALLAGLLAGCAVIVRYYTPILCLLPLAVLLLRERRWRVNVLWAAAGALPPLAFMLIYNHALTGHALLLSKGGVGQYDELWFAENAWRRGGEIMLSHLWDLMYWTPAALFIAYVAGARAVPLKSRLGAVGAGFACLVIGLYPYINRGGNQYGPRFYFDGFPLLVIAAAAALFGTTRYEDRSRGARRIVYLFFASLLAHVPIAVSQIQASHEEVVERLDVVRQVERAHLQHALVFVTTPVGVEYPMPVTDYIRNGITFDRPVLFALDRGDANRELEDYYSDRACYTYRYDPAVRTGSLTPCRARTVKN